MLDANTVITAAGSAIIGAGFFSWMTRRYIVKVDQVLLEVAKLSVLIKAIGELKTDIRAVEKRITITETKADAAHRRIDTLNSRH